MMMAIVAPPSIGRGWIACGIGSKRPLLTGSSSPVQIGWPETMSIKWSSLEEFERAGCRIEFLDQPLGQDPQDHLLVQIRGAVENTNGYCWRTPI